MNLRVPAILAGLVLAIGLQLPALAQETQHQHGDAAQMGGMTMADSEMHAAMQQMQQNMDMPMTGDPDVDFVRMMIPHHQGAIDMARIELAHGKDPVIRKLAEEVIAAQEKEIQMMRAWLAQQGQ
jgi:uncharacterized protein (DUF305 family)